MPIQACHECGKDVSTQAAACPHCGHPMAVGSQTLTARAPKVSHLAGWLAFAAFLLANFTPAILAPLFVFAGLALGGREIQVGSKSFGAVALCLCLLQGWFVFDHFAHIGASVGLQTAEQTDQGAQTKYQAVNMDAPADWRATATSKCQLEWPTDYRMQQYCIQQQGEGVVQLGLQPPADVDSGAFRIIRGKCSEEWPQDFKMRAYCEREQIEGYRSLKADARSDSTRNVCAEKWPTDYKMRRYCEVNG